MKKLNWPTAFVYVGLAVIVSATILGLIALGADRDTILAVIGPEAILFPLVTAFAGKLLKEGGE